jgi:hypothetical protein
MHYCGKPGRISSTSEIKMMNVADSSCPEAKFWHSAQGGKDIYNIEVPVKTKVPSNWSKQSATGVCPSYSSVK